MILRYGFLLLLWAFIFAIVYALRSDLFGAPARRMRGGDEPTPGPPARPAAPSVGTAPSAPSQSGDPIPSAGQSGPARKLTITSGVASGTEIPLDEDIVTIGRSSDSTLVIVDEYTSTYHAKLTRSGDSWTLIDLDSTNGTRLSGTKVTSPQPLPVFTPVTIGRTTFELRP